MAESTNLSRLVSLRSLVLQDPSHYKTVVPNILSFFAPGNVLEQRRFGADFLAEVFASPQLPVDDKEKIALQAIQTLRQYLDDWREDAAVIKSAVQASTSIYPLVFKHMCVTAPRPTILTVSQALQSHPRLKHVFLYLSDIYTDMHLSLLYFGFPTTFHLRIPVLQYLQPYTYTFAFVTVFTILMTMRHGCTCALSSRVSCAEWTLHLAECKSVVSSSSNGSSKYRPQARFQIRGWVPWFSIYPT